MKELSPFPYKVEINWPYERVRMGEYPELYDTVYSQTRIPREFNPLIKVCKIVIIKAWLNKEFGPREWDYEEYHPDPESTEEFQSRVWITARHEETITMVALKWN